MDRSEPAFTNLCRSAYTTFVERHPDLVLVWVNWPIDVGTARAAEAGTSIELDADPEAPNDTPLLLALVAPDLLPTRPRRRVRQDASVTRLSDHDAYVVEVFTASAVE